MASSLITAPNGTATLSLSKGYYAIETPRTLVKNESLIVRSTTGRRFQVFEPSPEIDDKRVYVFVTGDTDTVFEGANLTVDTEIIFNSID